MDKLNRETADIMAERFGKDSIIALATAEDGIPHVRNVDAYYESGSFYIITYSLSNKMPFAIMPTLSLPTTVTTVFFIISSILPLYGMLII